VAAAPTCGRQSHVASGAVRRAGDSVHGMRHGVRGSGIAGRGDDPGGSDLKTKARRDPRTILRRCGFPRVLCSEVS